MSRYNSYKVLDAIKSKRKQPLGKNEAYCPTCQKPFNLQETNAKVCGNCSEIFPSDFKECPFCRHTDIYNYFAKKDLNNIFKSVCKSCTEDQIERLRVKAEQKELVFLLTKICIETVLAKLTT